MNVDIAATTLVRAVKAVALQDIKTTTQTELSETAWSCGVEFLTAGRCEGSGPCRQRRTRPSPRELQLVKGARRVCQKQRSHGDESFVPTSSCAAPQLQVPLVARPRNQQILTNVGVPFRQHRSRCHALGGFTREGHSGRDCMEAGEGKASPRPCPRRRIQRHRPGTAPSCCSNSIVSIVNHVSAICPPRMWWKVVPESVTALPVAAMP